MSEKVVRGISITATVILITILLWLDQNRGGPVSILTRCNLLLSKANKPSADILLIGGSRSGTALDPTILQSLLTIESHEKRLTSVERIATPNNTLRVSHSLLQNYYKHRGLPKLVVFELSFMSERTIKHLRKRKFPIPVEHHLFRRDSNILSFLQILKQPSVSMPFSESEGKVNLLQFRAKGIIQRSGALFYQFLRAPLEVWDYERCNVYDRTREPQWPDDFAFSSGNILVQQSTSELILELEKEISESTPIRELKSWQSKLKNQTKSYGLMEKYRAGEIQILESTIKMLSDNGSQIVLVPLPIYGENPDQNELRMLVDLAPENIQLFDASKRISDNLSKFWYDDAHLEIHPAGTLVTALLAEYILGHELIVKNSQENERD